MSSLINQVRVNQGLSINQPQINILMGKASGEELLSFALDQLDFLVSQWGWTSGYWEQVFYAQICIQGNVNIAPKKTQ